MNIGDKMLLPIDCLETTRTDCVRLGEVVYIHPKHRFFNAEFTTESGVKFRESYAIDLSKSHTQRLLRRAMGTVGGRGHYER